MSSDSSRNKHLLLVGYTDFLFSTWQHIWCSGDIKINQNPFGGGCPEIPANTFRKMATTNIMKALRQSTPLLWLYVLIEEFFVNSF